MTVELLGHNADGAVLQVEVRLFNSLTRYNPDPGVVHRIAVGAGTTIGDLVSRLRIPTAEIFLVLRNGRDISPGLYAPGQINVHATVDDGDVIAFSGPVPYSWAYGAPVV